MICGARSLLLHPILDNALMIGTVSAVLLNLLMRIGVRKRVWNRFAAGHATHEAVAQFLSEQGAHWGARRDIVDRTIYGVLQLLDVLEVQSDITVDASFDELNLDVRVSYDGEAVQFPEERPSDEYIRENEDGVRLLAGYMLRGNADRLLSESKAGKAAVFFTWITDGTALARLRRCDRKFFFSAAGLGQLCHTLLARAINREQVGKAAK